MVAEVTTLYASNYRDPVSALREIAQEIEDGAYGRVGCVGVVLLGTTLEVFGAGPDSEGPSVVCALQAGAMKLLQPMVDQGRDGD